MAERASFTHGDALLVVDVINDFDHDDGDRLAASFRERLPAMTAAISAARTAGIPIIYANDEGGRWRSDAPGLIRDFLEKGAAAEVIKTLAPSREDHVLLKHRYSAFDHTAL